MASEFNTSFDLYRTNLGLVLHMFTFAEECRRNLCAFEAERVKRDLEASRKMQEAAAGAKDWNEFNTACQPVLRHYFETTNHIWQEALGSAMRNQIAFRDDMLEALKGWQSDWTAHYHKQSDVSAAGTPMHEWMQRFEQAFAGALDGAALRGGEKGSAANVAIGDGKSAIKGEQHVS